MTQRINPLWAAHNALYNEGAEGHNPHPQYIGESAEPLWSILDSRAYRLQRLLNGMSESDTRYAETLREYETVKAAAKIAMDQGV